MLLALSLLYWCSFPELTVVVIDGSLFRAGEDAPHLAVRPKKCTVCLTAFVGMALIFVLLEVQWFTTVYCHCFEIESQKINELD